MIWPLLLKTALRTTGGHQSGFPANVQFAVTVSFAWIAAIECFHAAKCETTNREHTGSMAILSSVCVASGAAVLLLALLGIPLPGMLQCALDALFLFVASVTINTLFRGIFHAESPLTRIVVVDTHVHVGGISWIITRKTVSRHEISGAIRLEAQESSRLVNVAHSLDEMVREIQREPVDGVLISASPAEIVRLSERLGACHGVGAPVRFVTGPGDGVPLRQSLSSANCLYLLNTGAAPTMSRNYSILKRGFDLIFSFAAILAGLPLIALIALAIKISSKGGIFFAQDRVGWNGKVFRMYKFRTMHTAPPCESDTRWSQPDDARRTAVGRFLRKYSLDELPQFFNVLKGEMSVVGPRPERPFFVNSFRSEIEEYHRRHQIKVGITGWAQVNGLRGDTCIRTRVMYDLYYLQNWGLIFDLKIILRTVLCVICGRDAD
ncbi:MAG: exopolysaccharide biosynthesis polyprenyl glycosylphosphotransferase [Terracidiphilus sp.]|jgi:exopolysaccharide biosynthesis polyprenyl glycosylphosphotransferase